MNSKRHDFNSARGAMQKIIDSQLLAGVSYAVLHDGETIELQTLGMADIEEQRPIAEDTLFRVFSNTKLITSCALLQLLEKGLISLDDPIEQYIPVLGQRLVLKPEAKSLSDVEPAQSSITIRHLLSHSSGLSYGLLDPGSLLFQAYSEKKILSPRQTLAQMVEQLAGLPLRFHPGQHWEYSIATDVLGRVIEIVSGDRFDDYLQRHIFDPLQMKDTGFSVASANASRLATMYEGVNPANALQSGISANHKLPYKGANLIEVPNKSGGGGLVSSLPDMARLMRALQGSNAMLLSAETRALLQQNQLADAQRVTFPATGRVENLGHGLAGAVTLHPSRIDPTGLPGDIHWGGLAATHWWLSPSRNAAVVIMTQRYMGFWHPFSFEFKRHIFSALDTA